jgi:hypothetical protein
VTLLAGGRSLSAFSSHDPTQGYCEYTMNAMARVMSIPIAPSSSHQSLFPSLSILCSASKLCIPLPL